MLSRFLSIYLSSSTQYADMLNFEAAEIKMGQLDADAGTDAALDTEVGCMEDRTGGGATIAAALLPEAP